MNEHTPLDGPPKKLEKLAVIVELAKPEQWQDLANIRLGALKSDPDSFFGKLIPVKIPSVDDEAEWKSHLEGGGEFFMFAKSGSEVVGMVGAYIDYEEKDAPEGLWCMKWAYVKKDFRNRGVGEQMYNAWLEELKKRGIKKAGAFLLNKNKSFDTVMHLMTKIGFHEVKPAPYDHCVRLDINLEAEKEPNTPKN